MRPVREHAGYGVATFGENEVDMTFIDCDGTAEALERPSAWATRIGKAKPSIITRYVGPVLQLEPELTVLSTGRPKAGDVVLARVDAVGSDDWLERPDGRRATLFVGDEIVVAYGARYATSQVGGLVPDDLGPCELLTCGGMAGRVVTAHAHAVRLTRLTPVGLVADRQRRVINMRDYAPVQPQAAPPTGHPPVIVVIGTSMDAGKTTTAGALIRGLSRAGRRVAAAKATGTGSGKDRWHLADAGASPVLDMCDAGLPSTHLVPADGLKAAYLGLLTALADTGPDVIVVEIADGLAHTETAGLLADPMVRGTVSQVVLAASDALGARSGCQLLDSLQLPVTAVSGLLTASPLSQREAAALVGVPVVGTRELCDPVVAEKPDRRRDGGVSRREPTVR